MHTVYKRMMYLASLKVVLLTFSSADSSFSFGNLSPAVKRFSIVIMDNIVSAMLCESILLFIAYITLAFLDIIHEISGGEKVLSRNRENVTMSEKLFFEKAGGNDCG